MLKKIKSKWAKYLSSLNREDPDYLGRGLCFSMMILILGIVCATVIAS